MHESMLARKLLSVVLQRASEEGVRRVLRVRGSIAEPEALSPDSIKLHFEAQARGSLVEGAELELRAIQLSARCAGCGDSYEPDHILLCPRCGSTEGELSGERGVWLETMDVE